MDQLPGAVHQRPCAFVNNQLLGHPVVIHARFLELLSQERLVQVPVNTGFALLLGGLLVPTLIRRLGLAFTLGNGLSWLASQGRPALAAKLGVGAA